MWRLFLLHVEVISFTKSIEKTTISVYNIIVGVTTR